jgi:hypothetical protein
MVGTRSIENYVSDSLSFIIISSLVPLMEVAHGAMTC